MDDISQKVATVEEVVLIKVMGGAAGPPGRDGKDGDSLEVFGPQAIEPVPKRRGAVWLYSGPDRSLRAAMNSGVATMPADEPPVVQTMPAAR